MKTLLIFQRKKLRQVLVYVIILCVALTLIPPLQLIAAPGDPLAVFRDDFNDGNADGWTTYGGGDSNNRGTWTVNPQGQYTINGCTGAKATYLGKSFGDLIYEADIQLNGYNSDNSGLIFRVSNPSGDQNDGYTGYFAAIRWDKKLELAKVTDGYHSLQTVSIPVTSGHMKVAAVGNNIKVYLNDMSIPLIDYTDNDADAITSPGSVGLRTWWGTTSFDNIDVREYSPTETAAPSFNTRAGIYNTAQAVSLSAVQGAAIHYTTDGSMPNAASPIYNSPISLSQTATIKAYAEKAGEMVSEVVSATYILGNSTQGFSENFEDGNSNGWTTFTGQTTTAAWAVSGGKYILNNSKGDKAVADNTSYDNFMFDADVNPGNSNDSSGLIFRCGDPGNGCDNLSGYFAGININGFIQIGKMDSAANNGNGGWTEILRAAAKVNPNQDNHLRVYADNSHFYIFVNGGLVADFTDTSYATGSIGVRGWSASGSVSFDNIQLTSLSALMDAVDAPTFSPTAGTFSDSQQVTMSCATPGATIYYTVDGSTPNSNSAVYGSPITVTQTTTVKAYASKNGMADSQVRSATYTKTTNGFSDDFSDGTYNKWTTYGGTWSVSGNNALNVNAGQGYKALAKNTEFTDVSYETDLKITSGTGDAGMLFRVTGATLGGDNVVGYYAGINVARNAVILGRMNNNWTELTNTAKTIAANTTYHMKVVAFGSSIKVFVDDMTTPAINFVDNTYTHGAIGLRIYNAAVSFGNVNAASYSAPVAIESFVPAQVATKAGTAPQMPRQVTAVYNNGTKGDVDVVWGNITEDKYENPGSFTVEGIVDGTDAKATAKVTVSAVPLAPGEAVPVGNKGPLVKTPFIPLPLGSVKADGWLLEQLKLQKDGATGHAEEIYSELGGNSAWLGGNAANSDWERPVYYVKGLVPLAYTLGDTELENKAGKWIEWALQSQKPDGSFGPATSNDWWPRMPMLYAMRDYYEATGDPRIITFMAKYFQYQSATLASRPLSDWGEARVGDNIDCVLWLYNRTQDANLLALADTLKSQGYDHTDIFTNDKFFGFGSDFHPNHNVNVSEDIKMPAVYYQRSGGTADKNAFIAGDRNLLKYHGQITGMSSGSEFLAGLSSTQPVELCAIVERMQSNEEAQMILGDPYLGDQLEKIAFNALPGALSKDFKEHQYYSLPNQVQSTNGARGHRQDYWNGLQPSPDSGFPCCRFNMHMGWPYYVKNMWAATDDGGIAAMAYGPSSVTTKINNQVITIAETTNYPFEEQMQFTVNTGAPNQFPLKLRIPEWCENPVVKVNSEVQAGVSTGEYYTINRTWADGDVVTLSVPMKIKTSTQVSNSIGVERGPLVYSLKIGENWHKLSERVAGYGEYEVLPTTPWNYGLIVDTGNPEASFIINKDTMPANPFIQEETPVTLTATAKRIPSWKLGPNGMDADEVPLGPVVSAQPEEQVTLVPFGAENLRVTYFPQITDANAPGSKKYEAEDAVVTDAAVRTGGNNYSTSVSNGKYVGSIDNADSSVQFDNVYARETGTYTLEIAYASGWAGYSTHQLIVNGGPVQTVKYSPIDGWGRFARTYVTVSLNKGNNTIKLAKGDNFAELDYIAVLKGEDLPAAISSVSVTPAANAAGTATDVTVTVVTANVADNTAVTAELVNADGTSLMTPVTANGTIVTNTASLTLNVPAAVVAGDYKIKVAVAGIATPDLSQAYTIAPADKTVLALKISAAQSLTEANYTGESWSVLQTALSAAIEVYNKADATQTEIDTAAENLQAAVAGLKDKGPVAAESIELNRDSRELEVDETYTLVATVFPKDASNKEVSFEPDNNKVVSVSDRVYNKEDGTTSVEIKAIGPGTATVTATTVSGGHKARCVVTVNDHQKTLQEIKLDDDSYSLYIGDTHQTVVTAVYSNGSQEVVTRLANFTPSDRSVATVSTEGLVKAVGTGSAAIQVTYGGKTASVNVTVERKSSSGHHSSSSNNTQTQPAPTPEPTPVPTPTPVPEKKTFRDIGDSYPWAKDAIEELAAKGIIKGTAGGRFEPDKNITRADFITLLVRALNLKADFDSNFTDVSKDAYYYEALGIAKKLGVATGVGDGRFNPGAEISRQDMMVLVERALKVAGKPVENGTASDIGRFVDASQVAEYAAQGVATLIREGIVKGSGNAIHPNGTATRAETAVIIYRVYKK